MKLNCIIDTCSCVFLSNAEFKQKNLLKYLNDAANLSYSPEVHKEITDHYKKGDKGLPTFIKDKRFKIPTKRWNIETYQNKMLGKNLPSRKRKGNRGEIDNFLLSLDLMHHIQKGGIVYITDDKKAINGVIGEWLPAFPGIQYWSSYDVILFLYAKSIIPSKDIAFDMVRDLNSVARLEEGISEDLNMRLQKLLKDMNNKIEKVSRIYS